MSKFTASQLVELANDIYEGAELEHLTDSGWTTLGTKAETVDALLHSWRIKPANKHDHIEELQELVATIRNDGELTDIVLYNVCAALEDFIDTIRMEIRDDDWS